MIVGTVSKMSSYCAGKEAAISSPVLNHLLVPSHDFALNSPAPKKWWEPKEAEHSGEQQWEDASNKLVSKRGMKLVHTRSSITERLHWHV
jgi:hypothetical protein